MVTITVNVGLDDLSTGLQTSTIGEPCIAAASSIVMVTGNW